MDTATLIKEGNAVLGIEFGSTRIKAVLIDENYHPVASGDFEWENQLVEGYWTYSMEEIWTGVQTAYRRLAEDVKKTYGVTLTRLKAMGISAMMHGYMAFNQEGELLIPFRTWRNSTTGEAAEKLTETFSFNIPQRWSIAHLYQAILSGEEHVKDISFLTTLAGYIHWKLTGNKVLGIGDASGMFPVSMATKDYDEVKLKQFADLIADKNYPWEIKQILPKVLVAGEPAGCLSEEGAKLLDVTGNLQAGIGCCPPEGDAGTGMTATNSVARRTGNVSAGTSIFAMVVMENELDKVHPEIDMVTTPEGNPVAMVHANNCTSDLNAWVNLFGEFAEAFGMDINRDDLYGTLYRKAMEGDKDCGGLMSYGYLSGENITGVEEGRPLFVRTPESNFNLSNFMRTHLMSSLGALKVGMDILLQEEKVTIDTIYGHGGLFKTKGVAQKLLASAIHTPVAVMETAGEGGPWGMALLAAFMADKHSQGTTSDADKDMTLQQYLSDCVFGGDEGIKEYPEKEEEEGFAVFIERYKKGIAAEKTAVSSF